jgi:hypothetical protein
LFEKRIFLNLTDTLTPMQSQDTIVNLLNSLINQHKNLTWKMKCCYTDGESRVIEEIRIFEMNHRYTLCGHITFNMINGQVERAEYKGYKADFAKDIVDTLLDLINYEKFRGKLEA